MIVFIFLMNLLALSILMLCCRCLICTNFLSLIWNFENFFCKLPLYVFSKFLVSNFFSTTKMYVKLSKVVNTERTLRFHSFSTYAKFSEKLTFLPPEMHTCVSSNWYHASYYLLTGALSILKIGNYWQTRELDDEKLRWRRK